MPEADAVVGVDGADVRVRAVGATAALVDVPTGSAATWRDLLLGLARSGRLPTPDDVVPGHRSVLVDGVAVHDVAAALRHVAAPPPTDVGSAGSVEIPVVYDGPDLDEVARVWGTDSASVVRRHTATDFVVGFCGFAPGFPYLLGLDDVVPRHGTPRTRVPAGSVALAGRYSGVYPTASPGGWQVVGRTGVRLFDPAAEPPALLPPGTHVRFVAVDEQPEPPADRRPADTDDTDDTGHALTVVRAGALTTVQDGGRRGLAHLGVPRAGALDRPAARLANRLVGNDEDAAVLETTYDGVAFRLDRGAAVAVTGAPAPVHVDGRAAEWGVAVAVPAGAVVEVGAAVVGLRSYVAVAGGLTAPPVLGSRSTDTLSWLGPSPLVADSRLPVGKPDGDPLTVPFTVPRAAAEVRIGVRLGPDVDWFTQDAVADLLRATYTVSAECNRVGARLDGPRVVRRRDDEMDSAGLVAGAVQVPPDGRPVVLLADHPTTGGYPVVGVVDPGDLPLLAQARPGTPVRLHRIGG